MNLLLSLLTFALPMLTGFCIVHSLWADKKDASNLTLKLSLGIGLGLGLSSILYFVYLLLFAGKNWFLFVEILLFIPALIVAVRKTKGSIRVEFSPLTRTQKWMLVIAGIVFLSSTFGILNYARQRALGDWDAWMIYNRAARFLYRDQTNWQESFPQEMTVIFHADYPLLLASNIATSWDILNKETPYVPMLQSVLFAFASLGLMFGALARLKSAGQASLGLILLIGVPFFIFESGGQTADLPLAFFMLATVTFNFFYHEEKRPVLIAFAGLTAGLAAWTKNEGLLFFLISATIITIAELRNRSLRAILTFIAGAVIPLTVSLYFKLALAPASEFLNGGIAKIAADVLDFSRHKFIFVSFMKLFLFNGGWYRVGILPILCVYYLLFHSSVKENPSPVFIGFAIFALQILGYYAFYLISPYELDWHVGSSIDRLFIHVYSTILFVTLMASQTPEMIFESVE